MSLYTCKRCGMCCIAAPCGASDVENEDGDCPYLFIENDLTTTCKNELAKEAFLGSGCLFQDPKILEMYKLHKDMYCVVERKKLMLRKQEVLS